MGRAVRMSMVGGGPSRPGGGIPPAHAPPCLSSAGRPRHTWEGNSVRDDRRGDRAGGNGVHRAVARYTRSSAARGGRGGSTMLSTMQDGPLLISGILRHGQQVYGDQPGGDHHRAGGRVGGSRPSPTWPAVRSSWRRRSAVSAIGDSRPGGDLPLEQPDPPGGLPGRAGHGRGAPHPQPPALPGAARLRHQPRRGPGHHLRRLHRRPAGPGARPDPDRAPHHHRRAPGTPPPSGRRLDYEALLAAEEPGYDWPRPRRAAGRGHVLHVGHDRQPEGCRLQPPVDLPAHDGHHLGQLTRDQRAGQRAVDRPDVPRQRLGHPLRRLHDRRRPDHAPAVPPGRTPVGHHQPVPPHHLRRGADHLERPAPLLAVESGRPVLPADDHRRRGGGAPPAHRAVP